MSAGEATLLAREPGARYLAAVQPALVRQFELLATAPGGVGRLRELIVLLALQGKLVEPGPQEASALDWLATIQANRDPVWAKGRRKVAKDLAPVDECERWFDLPAAWTWVRLNDLVTSSEAGWSPSCPETPRRGARWGVLKVSAVSWGVFDPAANKELPDELVPRPEYEVRSGDFLLSRANTAELVARSVVVGEAPPRLMLSDKIIRLTLAEGVNRAFINLCNNSSAARSYYVAKASGTSSSMKNVSREVVLGLPVPVPPIDEQARIVARVDELMRLCDALEAKGRLEAEQHARLLGTLLGTLTDSSTPEKLAANWQRVADHFDLLLDRPEAVDALEQTILQLAVRGLLVPQDPSDEPAIALMQRVRLARETRDLPDRARLGGISTSQAVVDEPFTLPAGWIWSTLPELCSITGGSTPSKAVASNWMGDIPWVSPKDMKVPVIEDAQDHVSSAALAGGLSLIEPGSLLMVVRGMILAHSFPVAVTQVPVTINQDMKALTPFEPRLLPFVMLLCEGMKTEVLALVDRSTHGTCKLESPKIFGLQMSLPPLAEQARIVARVTDLRRLCADLRQRLAASQTTQAHLAETMVDMAVA